MHYVSDSDAAAACESVVVDGRGQDGSERIAQNRGGVDCRVASADASGEGTIRDRIEGGAPGKEAAELRVAQLLVSRLNGLGQNWNIPRLIRADARSERGVDCVASDRSDPRVLLQIQVTTTEREAWRQTGAVHERETGRLAVVGMVRTAIEAKRTRADSKIVLALDATDSPRAAFRSVVELFRDQHGEWAAGVGFREVWLVGPAINLVSRLDT
jgi:hypothetical protein